MSAGYFPILHRFPLQSRKLRQLPDRWRRALFLCALALFGLAATFPSDCRKDQDHKGSSLMCGRNLH
jgi:hypothetical protein